MKLPVDGITELYISFHCTLNIYIYNIYIYMPGCDYKWFIPERPWLSLQISVRWKSGAHLWDALVNYLVQDDLEDNECYPWHDRQFVDQRLVTFGTYQLITSQVQSYINFLRGDNRQFMMASAWERGGSKLQSTWVLLVVHITWISQKSISRYT